MVKPNISFRVQPWHYDAIQREINQGKKLTEIFESLLDEKFPMSSNFHRS